MANSPRYNGMKSRMCWMVENYGKNYRRGAEYA